ncbi:FAD-dependent oxidoreductase [Methyloligella sp. 2.7D]|uniref:FAD-dependent oxidoreductase n=1 Tax=unclassified Methyloligella TaxID=2625955 RepID=UPI00157BC974|nr:FAD-dependent oxidoreductase [Methyloligella sp. GL2]QKP76740.1 FAD-dependent oxidoreductase [Methyloligella sp. GL2]
MAEKPAIAIRGAGIVGLWQALTLARGGFPVTLYEASPAPFADAASRYAGAMLAPRCEEESAEPLVRRLGLRGVELWQAAYPGTLTHGSLVIAHPRERTLLERFAKMTSAHERLNADEIAKLEPQLGTRFPAGLYFPDEAHMAPEPAMRFLLEEAQKAGAIFRPGEAEVSQPADITIDCRGMGAKADLPELRGVRGERIIVKSDEISLVRPLRLLHPRLSLYVVPRGNGEFMLGATAIESDENGPITVRSALELLSAAYAVDPAFGEAEIIAQGAGVRPAFPDNRPRIISHGRYIYVNGIYRHGFLLAPVLAELMLSYLQDGAAEPEIFVADRC